MSFEDCIDVVQEWVLSRGFLTTSFIDRGDPGSTDFQAAFFSVTNIWTDMDLSAIVPAGAKAVLFTISIRNSIISKFLGFRKKGDIAGVNASNTNTQVAFVFLDYDLICPLDDNRFIQYFKESGGTFAIFMTIKGWWF